MKSCSVDLFSLLVLVRCQKGSLNGEFLSSDDCGDFPNETRRMLYYNIKYKMGMTLQISGKNNSAEIISY